MSIRLSGQLRDAIKIQLSLRTPGENLRSPFWGADVLELLLPFVAGLKYGDEIKLSIPAEQMLIEGAKT